MWRKLFYLFAAITIAVSIVPFSLAEDKAVYGPIDCKTTKWHTHFSCHKFYVDDPEELTDISITVSNINPRKWVRHGILLFNRRPILLPRMKGKSEILIPLKGFLRSRNHLKVLLTGPPGASVRIEIKQSAGALSPPQIAFAAEPSSIGKGETTILSWAVVDADKVVIDNAIGAVASNGTTSVSPNKTTTYTLTAVNSAGKALAETTVTVLNTTPVAMDDTVITDENTPVTMASVLDNDRDLDGDALTVSDFTQPAHGTVVSLGGGVFRYTPADEFSGQDSFSYTVSDGRGATDTAAVVLQVIPAALSLEILSPGQGQVFTDDTISVAGVVSRSGASVYVNGIKAVVSGTAFTAEQIPLLPGVNTINVLAEQGPETAVASVAVLQDTTVDLQPILVEMASLSENEGSLKIAGRAMVTIGNNGISGVSVPYQIVLFEDTNLNGSYEKDEDNGLGETIVSSGPGAGQSANFGIDFSGQLQFRDNRLHVHVDSTGAVKESEENNNTIASQVGGTDLSTSLLVIDDTSCPDEIVMTVRIGNAGDNSLPAGVPVAFYDGEPGNGGVHINTLYTSQSLEPGQFQDLNLSWYHPTIGVRMVYVLGDDDGTGIASLSEIDDENNRFISTVMICTVPAGQEYGISGQVIDAVTGDVLPGASVSLYQNNNGVSGPLVYQTVTDGYGAYIFPDIGSGDYLLVAELVGYSTVHRPADLEDGETLTHQNLVLSPALGTGELRIVLTWGAQPTDLEAHLTAPNPDGCRHHCYHWDKTIPGAGLDIDDMDSYGPETITISQLESGTYRFYVHDFSNRLSRSSTVLSNSGATVTVYSGDDEAPQEFTVPSGAGNVWHVFNLDGASGALTPIDRMTHQDHPGTIDYPRIISSPVTSTAYKETYTYQVAAEDPDQDTLTYSLVKGPEGMRLDPFSGLIQWTPSAGQEVWQDVIIRANDGRCGQDTQIFRIFLTYMPQVEFDITPCSGINPGGEVTLTWQTERADTVVIDQGVGEVDASGSLSFPSPDEPAAYSLTATNGAGQSTRTIPKTVRIKSFSRGCISDTNEIELTWETGCAANCWIDHGVGQVPVNGSIVDIFSEMPPDYTLTCSNANQTTSMPLENRCASPSQINVGVPCCWSSGDPVTIEWRAIGAEACSIAPDVGSVPPNGSVAVFPTNLPERYTLTCDNVWEYGYAVNQNTVHLTASKTALLTGESTTLNWLTKCYDSCSFDQGIGEVPTSGSLVVTPSRLPITYTLTSTCGQLTQTNAITIRARSPEAIFTASPALIKTGESASLTWTTERATSCNIHPDIGEVDLNGSITVTPDQNTAYTLTATGPGGTIEKRATVAYIKPSAAIYADPTALDTPGQTTTLTWVFSDADTCSIDPEIGQVQLGGSTEINPIKTTTYTITAAGPGGVATNSVTVTLPSPEVTFSVDREILEEGETATLTWASINADTCFIKPDIGEVPAEGSIVVDPDRTTTYTITARGPGGTATGSVTLTCLAPTASIQVDPTTIIEGQAATVVWRTAHASDANLEPALGQVAAEGTITVLPNLTTTYTLTASGRGGAAKAETTLTVINPPSINLIEPDGIEDDANANFTIMWNDRDPDSDAVISLYYDINNYGEDGTLIVAGLDENAEGHDDQYVWETSGIPDGTYYVYASIDDGVNAPVVEYSDGTVAIDHAAGDEIKLIAGDGSANDSFGRAVSIDRGYAVVGAPNHGDTGAAYIFNNQGSAWNQQTALTGNDGEPADHFGHSVSISGDTVVVGAPHGNENRGAAYVFRREGTTWTQEARLTAVDGMAWDNFGQWLCISDDTLVVGAPGQEGDAGAAYVFEREGSTWNSPLKLTADSGDGPGRFGTAVSIYGDVLIVGAPTAGNGAGAAYVFRRMGTDWIQETRLSASDVRDGSRFGNRVDITDNYAIVGNVGMSEEMIEGTAYIFMYDGTTWNEQAKIAGSDVGAWESFGSDVSIDGNVAAVGEPKVWNSAGAVYLFNRTTDGWGWQDATVTDEEGGEGEGDGLHDASIPSDAFQELSPSDGQPEDYFGSAVDMDADHVIAGAIFDDDNGDASGSAYVYSLFSVSIRVEPSTIRVAGEGGAATLTWSSRGADSVRIDPGIGVVDASGSITIAPLQTTTYTITGFRDGVSITDNTTVAVNDATAMPAVTISAAPETIYRGDSATLSWSAANVEAVTLDNQIGTAPMIGSLAVSPVKTTTYTITASNERGTSTANVTIAVTDPPPIVELAAEPEQILTGDAATLIWNTTFADTVSIDQDIGMLEPNGRMVVFPSQTTTYTLTATGSGGTVTVSAAVTVNHPITLKITEPLEGDNINARDVTVRGTIFHERDIETGLLVNGVPVIIDGDQFMANHVPLVQGENTLTATATDADGLTLSDSITVDADIPKDYIRLTASPISGTPPFETTLRTDSSFAIASSQITYFGPDDDVFLDRSIEENRIRVTTEGIHTFEVEVTDLDGNVYTDDVSVEVVDRETLDALLQDKWRKMKSALMAGDVQRALEYHHESAWDRYSAIYNALGDDLAMLAGQMQDIALICFVDGFAKYRIRQDHEVSGQVKTITYYIYFSRGKNGLWLIERY